MCGVALPGATRMGFARAGRGAVKSSHCFVRFCQIQYRRGTLDNQIIMFMFVFVHEVQIVIVCMNLIKKNLRIPGLQFASLRPKDIIWICPIRMLENVEWELNLLGTLEP